MCKSGVEVVHTEFYPYVSAVQLCNSTDGHMLSVSEILLLFNTLIAKRQFRWDDVTDEDHMAMRDYLFGLMGAVSGDSSEQRVLLSMPWYQTAGYEMRDLKDPVDGQPRSAIEIGPLQTDQLIVCCW